MRVLTLLLAPFFILPALVYAVGERINHIRIPSTFVGSPIEVIASVEGGSRYPVEAKIFYRSDDHEPFLYVEMSIERRDLKGVIPGPSVRLLELEYYLEVELDDGQKVRFPEGAPDAVQPLRIAVKPLDSNEKASEGIIILSPEPGAPQSEDQVLVAVSFLQGVRKINPFDVNIEVDGQNLTSKASLSEELLTLTLTKLTPGRHYITLYLVSAGKKVKLAGWAFTQTTEAEKAAWRIPVQGAFTAGYNHEDVSEQSRDVKYADGRLLGNVGKMEWIARAYNTSLENPAYQPQNRYLAAISYKGLDLRGGDTRPKFSEFSLWGIRSRGAEMNLKTKFLNLDLAWGEVNHAVDGVGTYDTTAVDTTDSITIKPRIIKAGVFKRNLIAVRPGIHFSRNSALSFNILKVKDDVESVEWGGRPKDNVVIGADLKIQNTSQRFTFATETAISLYNDDITEGPMDQSKDYEDYIIINKFFDPMPPDSSVLDDSTKDQDRIKSVLKELVKSALAHRTSLTLNYLHNEFQVGYKSIGRSFHSLGSPTVQTDVAGVFIQNRIRLFNNRVYLNAGYEGYANNVNKRVKTKTGQPFVTDRQIIRGGIAIYSPPQYPNINFGIRFYDRSNNGAEDVNVSHSGDTLITNNQVDQSTNSYNFWVDQSFRLARSEHTAALMFNSTLGDDKIHSEYNTKLGSQGLTLNSRFGPRLETKIAVNSSSQEARAGRNNNDYLTVSASGRYMLVYQVLWLSGGVNFSQGQGGNDPINPYPDTTGITDSTQIAQLEDQTSRASVLDYGRWEFSAGLEFRYKDHHEFNLFAYRAAQTDDGYMDYYSNRRMWNRDSAVKQDDLAVRLRYTFKF